MDVDSLKLIRLRNIGCEHVALEAFNVLGIGEHLKVLGFNGPQLAAATGSIIGRMCRPGQSTGNASLASGCFWAGQADDYDFGKMNLYKMYSVSDQLLKNKDAIERHLSLQKKKLFGFQGTIILYDLTNTYFEGQGKSNRLGKFGRSPKKRSDCPLATLALVLDSSGFPRCSKVFEGNVSEADTLAQIISTMDAGRKSLNMLDEPKATIVMDTGIASEDNIKWIKEKVYPYFVVSHQRHRQFSEEESAVIKQDKNGSVKVQKVIAPESNEVLLYCHSKKQEEKERSIHERFTSGFEDGIPYLAAGLHIKGRMKTYDKVLKKIGHLKQRYSRVSGQYQIDVVKDTQTGNAVQLTWKHQTDQGTRKDLPGVYCLRPPNKDLDEKTLWHTDIMLTDQEAVFRSLKSELGICPVFHQVTERVIGHLFISVLAYHLVHSVRYRLKHSQITSSWAQLRNQLEGQSRVTVSMQCKDAQTAHIRKSTRPEPRQQKSYKALKIDLHTGQVIKTILNTGSINEKPCDYKPYNL